MVGCKGFYDFNIRAVEGFVRQFPELLPETCWTAALVLHWFLKLITLWNPSIGTSKQRVPVSHFAQTDAADRL